jgi:signal transduction histidine kinase/CheY-like chemotaxis protein
MAAATLLLVGATVALVAILPSRLDVLSRRWMESRALGIAGLVARAAEPALDFDDETTAAAALAPLGDAASYAAVVRADGHVLAFTGRLPALLLADTGARRTFYAADVLRVRVPLVTRTGAAGAVEIGFGLQELEERRREARTLVVVLSLVLFAVGLAAAWGIGTALARPVRRVTAVARRIAGGEEEAARDLPLDDRGEAGALAHAFTLMLQKLWNQASVIQVMNVTLASRIEEREQELARTNEALAALRRTQEQLVVADRRVSIGRLAAGVGHEINNPLAYVSGNLEWLGEELETQLRALRASDAEPALIATALDEMASVVRESLDGTDRVRRIVQQLRTFSRGDDEDRKVPLDVTQALEVAIDMGRHETKHHARLVRRYGRAPAVRANPVQLAQVFLNLLVNAAQAIRKGAPDENEICIEVSTDADGWVAVDVSDTGGGIAPDVLPRLFEPFFTTKPPGVGTGLGLSVSRGIVRGLGGDILVRSAPGVGSTFTVRLPPCEEPAEAPAPASAARVTPPPAAGARRILVVDDEPLVLSSMQRLLRGWGEVRTTASGRQALEALRNGHSYDLVLCDVVMPDMSGVDVYRTVSSERPQQASRFVFVTGGASDAAAREFLDGWTGPCLYKPLSLEKLRRVIDERHW